jgi:hypothetical protein
MAAATAAAPLSIARDRCLFRLRDPAVRRKVAPLLLGDRT